MLYLLLASTIAHAVPPPGAAVGAAALPPLRWVEHRVIPGDRIREIAQLYDVSSKDIVEWNDLDRERPMIRTGQKLRIHTREPAVDRQRTLYTVRRGDSWHRIARRHDVKVWRLRERWNPGLESLQPGHRIVVWTTVVEEPEPEPQAVEPEPQPTASATTAATEVETLVGEGVLLPIIRVRGDAESVGRPGHGRLRNGVALPENPALYTLRRPQHSYGSSHVIMHLQRAIARFRATSGFTRELVIADMSRRRGGRFRPHSSHRSGRDVDIRLPLRDGVPVGTVPHSAHQVDWDATWALMKALIATDQVTYIFLSRPRQRPLRAAAVRAGESEQALTDLIQFPGHARKAVVRHSRGHIKHFHVRFKCGPNEQRCRD